MDPTFNYFTNNCRVFSYRFSKKIDSPRYYSKRRRKIPSLLIQILMYYQPDGCFEVSDFYIQVAYANTTQTNLSQLNNGKKHKYVQLRKKCNIPGLPKAKSKVSRIICSRANYFVTSFTSAITVQHQYQYLHAEVFFEPPNITNAPQSYRKSGPWGGTHNGIDTDNRRRERINVFLITARSCFGFFLKNVFFFRAIIYIQRIC